MCLGIQDKGSGCLGFTEEVSSTHGPGRVGEIRTVTMPRAGGSLANYRQGGRKEQRCK